jgi:hypothetical protein
LQVGGTLRAWGSDQHEQVTDCPSGFFLQVASGGYHSVALRTDRTVVAWGRNSAGQCDAPLELGRCKQVAAGRHHSVALRVLPCVGDVNGDGVHSGQDIGALFAAFGAADPFADLDGDGIVTSLDFSIMLAAWGTCAQE